MARTQCIIDPGNAASIRLATVLGYVRHGEARYHDRAILCFERIAAG
jgi:RimJ/RimL family protein N-acetyltransferase